MYGTRELNHKKQLLLKFYKLKYFTDKDNSSIYEVIDAIVEFNRKTINLVFVEVGTKHKSNALVGMYKELTRISTAKYYLNKIAFEKKFHHISNKDECFNIAQALD